MRRTQISKIFFGSVAAGLIANGFAIAAVQDPRPEPPMPASAKAHYDRARAIAAGDPDLQFWMRRSDFCMSPMAHDVFADNISRAVMKPAKIADNLYLVGTGHVNTWILKTSAGLVLFDTMHNTQEAKDLIEGGIRELGLNPADIKYIFLTHGHTDHWGGARYLQDKYKIPVATGDWDFLLADPVKRTAPGSPPDDPQAAPAKPVKDVVLTDGQTVTIGDVTIKHISTPGHTPNTSSYIIPVKVNGVVHNFAMWGGTNFPRNQAGLSKFHDSLHVFWNAASADHAESLINPHAFFYDAFEKIEAAKTARTNPFLMGEEKVQRTLAMQDECFGALWGWFNVLGYK